MDSRQPQNRHHAERDDYTSHRIYTPRVLAIYDWWVLGVSNRWIWKCPTSRLLAHYNRHVTANHLDVGVGTGYFLDRCRWPSDSPQIALLDVNLHALRAASRRIARYRPTIVEANIAQQLPLMPSSFTSIGLNYVLHCLPGTMAEKSTVIGQLAQNLSPSGVLFGATLLGRDVPRGRTAKWLMRRYQKRGFFGNADDDLGGLRATLQKYLRDVSIEVVGCAAVFAGRRS